MANPESLLIEEGAEIPVPPASPDIAPKRGPGRPKGSANKGGTRARSTSAGIRQACVAVVGAGNLALVAARRWFKGIREDDPLNEQEMGMLARALEAEAQANARIGNWMQKAGGLSAHALLIEAAIVIGTARLQRRGILPALPEEGSPEYNAMLERMRQNAQREESNPDASIPVEAGRTSFSNGANW